MSYRCGIYEPLASIMGVEPGPPRITCDGCGVVLKIGERRLPPAWFLDGKAPPRWRTEKHDDGTRSDWCPACKTTKQGPQ
jgi:hypothetical protein